MSPCDICGAEVPVERWSEHSLEECRHHLLRRVQATQRQAGVLRPTHIKDQSGVALSSEFMRERGLGRYRLQETRRTLERRVTEPITLEHYMATTESRRCLSCPAMIRVVLRPDGGQFWVCAADAVKGCGWYISWYAGKGEGRQVLLGRAA